jgi:phosphoribosyl 1,2-cyclic phosphodiesterase
MKVTFWGVRGSIPIPGPDTVRYGGNTTCIEVQGLQNECLVFDAGTGIRRLGMDLLQRRNPLTPIHLFISHTHWDHIQGFPFFVPFYLPGSAIHVRGPEYFLENRSLRDILSSQMQHEFFPVSNQQLAAQVIYEDISETSLAVGGIAVRSQFMNHTVRSLGFRISEQGRTLVYTGDHEPYYNMFDCSAGEERQDDESLFGGIEDAVAGAAERFVDFIRGADVLIVDGQYTPGEYPSQKRTWGHSSWDFCLDWMQQADVGTMVLTHHDPARTDDALDEIKQAVADAARSRDIDPQRVRLAREGMRFDV